MLPHRAAELSILTFKRRGEEKLCKEHSILVRPAAYSEIPMNGPITRAATSCPVLPAPANDHGLRPASPGLQTARCGESCGKDSRVLLSVAFEASVGKGGRLTDIEAVKRLCDVIIDDETAAVARSKSRFASRDTLVRQTDSVASRFHPDPRKSSERCLLRSI
jgi:hypothetical protein